jgi:hypothetical protein
MEQENIILSEDSQAQKARNHLFSSNVDFQPKTNTVILLDMGHTLRGEYVQEKLRKHRKSKA